MAEQDWQSVYPLAGDPLRATPPAARYELRPLSVGEILDRIFSLYRTHFWLFAGLSALSAGVYAGISVLRLAFAHFVSAGVGSPAYIFINAGVALAQLAVYLVAYSITLAATTSAVNALYLGQPASFQTTLAIARGLWLRCLGITFWQGWSAIWIFLLLMVPFIFLATLINAGLGWLSVILGFGMFASLIYGVIAFLRNSLAVPAAVVEGLSVRAAMRRSKQLASGRTGRIFLLMLLFYALLIVAALIEVPLGVLALRSHAAELYATQAIALGVNFISATLVGPVMAIGLCLFYFDERIRREAFDIEMLLHGVSPPPLPAILPDAFSDPTPEQI